ncbi:MULTISPECIES: hypothetical protein [Bradyrhizobium]|uniref:hypothetical protein n=1 Tax=Bradyrhizobium TaxID=374 RepID=UPI00067E9700|nr:MULTISPECIES: hypothetical protein [Bradyrhizobium]PAY06455.1 hypothetical protein CK489_26585 [Bradyrhizobium sp. UFLA03-84]
MSLRSARDPESARFAAITPRFTAQAPFCFTPQAFSFTPRAACGPIEPVFPALLRSAVFFTALALPFVVALYAA